MQHLALQAVIFDIDGTLANINHRLHFIKTENKDWDNFFAHMDKDTPIESMIKLCNLMYQQEHKVLVVTGRPDNYRELTQSWLKQQGVDYHELYMRKAGDRRPDWIVKQEILQNLPYDIWYAVDDKPQVVDMYRKQGLACLHCLF